MTYHNNHRIDEDEAYDLKWKLNLRQYQLSLLFPRPIPLPRSHQTKRIRLYIL